MEVSTIVARNEIDIKVYPISQNFHKDGILIYNITPAKIPKKLENKIYEIAIELSKSLNLIGIMAIEFFVKNDDVLINEIAPRPHNSGHWTLDGSTTSQFEQFLRAILNLPLGETNLIKPTLMINLLGVDKPNLNEIFKIKNSYFYWYFKEKRIRRKMGHINILLDEYDNFDEIVKSMLCLNSLSSK
jgi:5-(carboxyamino)imidazole ribonucleotide synthase